MRRPETPVSGHGPLRPASSPPLDTRRDVAMRVVIRELVESMECLVADPSRWDEESARRHLSHVRQILEGSRRRPPAPSLAEAPLGRRPATPWEWLCASREDESVTQDLQRSFL